ncbi:scaffold/adaptor protein [Lithospermum erythrorhizon]|uniref:Scaffold/adaptor protein n=1 Tax=Lithospermum erythrorhizon TaxID=34254 RepID=A0AAV3RDV9_LITER
MGWQGTDPSTDFRGGGFISLENLIYFAKAYPESFQDLLSKRIGERSEWEYPFAVAGINISFVLVVWYKCWIFNQEHLVHWQEFVFWNYLVWMIWHLIISFV